MVAATVAGFAGYLDLHRIVQVALGDLADHRRHGGGEQGDLAALRRVFQDPLHVVDEPHPEHLVRFVQHQGLQVVQAQGLAAQVIHDPARRADHHVNAALQLLQLEFDRLAAVDRHDVKTLEVAGVGLERLGHLDRQFPGRGQHQDLGTFQRQVDAAQQRQREGGGLAGAGLGLAQEIVALRAGEGSPPPGSGRAPRSRRR